MHIPPQNLTSQILSDNPFASPKFSRSNQESFNVTSLIINTDDGTSRKNHESLKNKRKKGTYKTPIVEDFEVSTIFSFYI